MTRAHPFRLGVLAAASLLIGANASADSIKIAVTGPFSGGSAPLGISAREGARLAIAEINATGGVKIGNKKFTIEAVERDDEAKNERGAIVAQELSSMNDLVAVVGTVNTGVILAGDKYYQQAKKPRIVAVASGSAAMAQWVKEPTVIPKGELYCFRLSANDGIQMDVIVDEAVRKLGKKKIGILADDTNYGVSTRDDLLKRLNAIAGVQVVANEKFSIGTKDMTAQLLKARAAGAEALYLVGVGPELAAITNGMTKLGYKVPFLGSWTLSSANFIDNAGASSNGALMPQTFIQEDYSTRAKNFIAAYKAAYKVDRIPSAMAAAQSYDAMKIMAAAIEQAGSTDGKAIKEALENLRTPVEGAVSRWVKPFSTWDPAVPESHEGVRREHVFVGTLSDGKVTFAHDEDRKRLQQLDK
jgi:branched-chain amino acid transport system substrate-binding protein